MTTAIITHESFAWHKTPPGHPERVARIEALRKELDQPAYAGALRIKAEPCADEHLELAHPKSYIAGIRDAIPASGYNSLDPDTHACPSSLDAILRAAGANVQAVDLVMSGRARNAFVAARPPGHHAERNRAMGFCFFSNAAIAALHSLHAHGLERVAVIDFDVHHGNGTSDVLWNESRTLFASTHQMPLYPGTGYAEETGKYDQIVNAPLHPGAGSAEFRMVMREKVLPRVDAFEPRLIVISAGFDAHQNDPLAALRLRTDDFAWITRRICELARDHAKGRVISTLEGGYDIGALVASAGAHVRTLMEA